MYPQRCAWRNGTSIPNQLYQQLAGQPTEASRTLAQRLNEASFRLRHELSAQARTEGPGNLSASAADSYRKQMDFMIFQLAQVELALQKGDGESARLYLHTLTPWTQPNHFSAQQ